MSELDAVREWYVLATGRCVPLVRRNRTGNPAAALQTEVRRAADLNRQAVWATAYARRMRRNSQAFRLMARLRATLLRAGTTEQLF